MKMMKFENTVHLGRYYGNGWPTTLPLNIPLIRWIGSPALVHIAIDECSQGTIPTVLLTQWMAGSDGMTRDRGRSLSIRN